MLEHTHLLAVWEAGLTVKDPSVRRATLLHALSRRDRTAEELLDVSVGDRERDLLGLRRLLFGDRLNARLKCATCNEELEFDVDISTLHAKASEPEPLVMGEWTVDFRLPTIRDLADARSLAEFDTSRARVALISSVVVAARRSGSERPPAELPRSVISALAAKIGAVDPNSDTRFNMVCPGCGDRLQAQLDIAACLWDELDAWARHMLNDVHLLASTYGWSEPDVLALSPFRRRHYLELAGHG